MNAFLPFIHLCILLFKITLLGEEEEEEEEKISSAVNFRQEELNRVYVFITLIIRKIEEKNLNQDNLTNCKIILKYYQVKDTTLPKPTISNRMIHFKTQKITIS